MKRTFAGRLLISSVVAAGAASAASACTSTDPVLPVEPVVVSTSSTSAPPPVSGGTLHVTAKNLAVAADSDRDLVWLVDLNAQKLVATVTLQPGDEPGRVVEDGAGRVHVALRGAGAVATIDLASAKVVDRTAVCSAPRGLAYDAVAQVVHVACAGGELITLPAAGGAPLRELRFAERDLRDVIVQDGKLVVTRFRSAELLTLDATGTVVTRHSPPSITDSSLVGATFSPTVAWRAIPRPGKPAGVLMVNQIAANSTIVISQPGGYGSSGGGNGSGCDGTIVHTTVTTFDSTAQTTNDTPVFINGAAVPVDIASDPAGNYAIASAGSDEVFFSQGAGAPGINGSGPGPEPGPLNSASPCTSNPAVSLPGLPVAVDYSAGSSTIPGESVFAVQVREPASILLVTAGSAKPMATISLGGAARFDTGHDIFHHNASAKSPLACAGCHPEGHDDGHTWSFDTSGERRTQTVSGGVLATAPLHWDGSMHDLPEIMDEVFVNRMGGTRQGPQHVAAFSQWLDSIPAYPASPTGSEASIQHGKELFFSGSVGCDNCHNGTHFTNNQTVNVGTGRPFQVPTLIGVAARAPYMHDGCAATLADRFDHSKASCNGGSRHGNTAQLSASDVTDLISYLETL